MQRADRSAITVERRQRLAFRSFGEVLDRGNNVTRGLLEIRLEVAVPHYPFVGVEVNQNQRPVLKQANFRDNRPLQGHNDRSCSNTLESELNARHTWPP